MRKQSNFIALTLFLCSLAVLVAAATVTRNAETKICTVAEEQTERLKPLDGSMLWESLFSQFVSSVHQ